MIQKLGSTSFLNSLKEADFEVFEDVPLWLKKARTDDLNFLMSMDVPTFKDEEWKYSALTSLWVQSFMRSARTDGVFPDELRAFFIDGALNVTVFDGHVLGSDDAVPSGISVSVGDSAYKFLDGVESFFNTITRNDAQLFFRLNRALFNDPLTITVDPGLEQPKLLHIVHIVSVPGSAVFPRVFVSVGKGAAVNLLQTYVSLPGIDFLSVPVTDITLGEGARLEYAERHVHSPISSHIGSVRVWQKKDSTLSSFVSTCGAGLFRSNFSVMLEGEGSSAEINGLHALQGEAHADSHTFLEHLAPNTTSNQLYKCVLQDGSRSVFNGRVFVHREAQQTNSYQLNKNLLLSRECRVDTKPQLEIKADDVKCTHGATIGQLDEDQLFYLQTRALPKEDAVRMLVRGFIDDVLLRIKHPLIREAFKKV